MQSIESHTKSVLLFMSLLVLTGCQTMALKSSDHANEVSAEMTNEKQQVNDANQQLVDLVTRLQTAKPAVFLPINRLEVHELLLSRGDRLRVDVAEGEHFSGLFEVGVAGNLHIPYIKPIQAAGKTLSDVEKSLRHSLVDEKIFKPEFVQVSVRIQQWSGVHISVAGAVFFPGRVLINDRDVEVKAHQLTQDTGDFPMERFLTTAIRSAGGVRPDADLANIRLIRGGKSTTFNLSAILIGGLVHDVPLVAGDQIIVPSVGYLQNELMRPSPITPPGFDIFISNLTTPADSNAKAAIGKEARSMPYGTRLLRGLISANCIGGTQATNASRMAVLVTTNRISGQSRVIQRSVEELLQHHNRDEFNPYLMPNDGIACYDSGVTNARDVARTFSDIFNPILMLRILMGAGS